MTRPETKAAAAPIITATGLTKSYGAVEAVRGVDFTVPAGRCIGLLGPNGAGKTTTMKMITGLAQPTDGTLTVFGEPASKLARATRGRIGLVPQENNLDADLSVRQNLDMYGRYFGLPRAHIAERVPQLLDFMELSEKADARVQALSGGMKRRLVIARALIADPDLIILDEPTTGLDPQARVLIWKRLQQLKKQGKTLLLTTHYMDEAERLCDDLVIIDHGRVLDTGTPADLIRRRVKGEVFEVTKPVPKGLSAGGADSEDIGESVLFYVADAPAFAKKLPEGITYLHRPANLEDVFLRLTGRKLRETA